MRCLVIDDSPEDRSLVERMLQRWGHRATAVASGSEALQLLAHERYDVVLVDLDMPGMTGAETIVLMRTLVADMRVLVVSGREDKRHVLEALDAGADGYLLKDDLADGLGKALQDVVAGKGPLSSAVGAILVKQVTGRNRPALQKKPLPMKLADASGELIVAGGLKKAEG